MSHLRTPTRELPRTSPEARGTATRMLAPAFALAVVLVGLPTAAADGPVSSNRSVVRFTDCANPQQGCPETHPGMPTDGSLPPGQYFAPSMPVELLDRPPPAGQRMNVPPGHNIGLNEGRLRSDLRAAARVADPLRCTLPLAALKYASGSPVEGQAYADLSVAGHAAFARFRAAQPGPAFCASLRNAAPDLAGCPAAAAAPNQAGLVAGCQSALRRAYKVANYLRTGQIIRAAGPWSSPDGTATQAFTSEQARKSNERKTLGWIAVSGEDDSPHRPVNVPSSDFPQYDLQVEVDTPLAAPPHPKRSSVRTRFIIAQSNGPAPVVGPAQEFALAAEPAPSIAPDSEVLLFVHGMDSRAEEAEDLAKAMFALLARQRNSRNLAVIAVDLPTSGYAENLDYDSISPLDAIGVPAGVNDFRMTGRMPLLDFYEEFMVAFVETLDRRTPFKSGVRAVMGGSLGGSLSFRLGRRPNTPWLPSAIVWSPASIWDSLGGGADLLKHIGPRMAWWDANNRDPNDPNDLSEKRLALRAAFFGSWDKPIVPILIPASQADTWQSQYYLYKAASVAGARLSRHETYDPRFLSWRSRLAAEQLLYSHQAMSPATNQPLWRSNRKPMLLACGLEDNVMFNGICNATQGTAARMALTPGKAVFLDKTGHSLHDERTQYWAGEVLAFLHRKGSLASAQGRCLGVSGTQSANGVAVELQSCDGRPGQDWQVTVDGKITGLAGRCLDVTAGNSSDGTALQLWDCHGQSNQLWKVRGSGPIVGLAGKCLDVMGKQPVTGSRAQLWSCGPGVTQQWTYPGPVQLERSAGESCSANEECFSLLCHGPSGNRCVFNRDGPAGAFCTDHAQCTSQYCQVAAGARDGTCGPEQLVPGSPCMANAQCRSGICHHPSGNRCVFNRDGPIGGFCTDHAQCKSQRCSVPRGAREGVCVQ